MKILVGDVGGTNTRLGLAVRENDGWSLQRLEVFATPDLLSPLVERYCAGLKMSDWTPDAAALCGAGPRREDGRIVLTNRSTVLDAAELAAAAGVPQASLLNDFEAVGWSLPAYRPADLRACGAGVANPAAPRVVLGAGTGLGIAALLPDGDNWRVLPCEGGHADLSPVDELELSAWTQLRMRLRRVTSEHVLSGPGLARLHAALHPGTALTAPEIGRALIAGDAAAVATGRCWARWLGRLAGNLALHFNAGGGIYIAGGIVPSWGEHFDAAAFREGFEDKLPFVDWLRGVPAYVVTHPYPGLLGLAVAAAAKRHP